jgi:type IV pilus assembly protein PilY1
VEDVVADSCASGRVISQLTGDTTIYNCETLKTVDPVCSKGEFGYSGNLTSLTKSASDPEYCKVPMANACTGTMNSKVSSTSDTRTIKTANSTGTALINFDASYAAANTGYFDATHISTLSQWTSLTASQQSNAVGANLLKFLRGQYAYEDRTANDGPPDNKLFRYRSTVLGDVLESKPTFVGNPIFNYPYPGYADFKSTGTAASREGIVYVGANDGMLHAFTSKTVGVVPGGTEKWAYVPSMVIPNMWKLADKNYSTLHVNYVNGSPASSDVCTDNCTCDSACVAGGGSAPVWKTIVVGGLNAGGRGFYALDITDPTAPALLWELTPTTGIGKIQDDDVGFSYGRPIIARKPDGTWVVIVSSGYNNTSPGDGKGYLYVLNVKTGSIISKIATGVGTTATPSGLDLWRRFAGQPLAL